MGGALPVLIPCWINSVYPISDEDLENTSWNFNKNSLSFLLSDSLSAFELLFYNSVKCSDRSNPGNIFTSCTLIGLFTTVLTSAGSNLAAIVFL